MTGGLNEMAGVIYTKTVLVIGYSHYCISCVSTVVVSLIWSFKFSL